MKWFKHYTDMRNSNSVNAFIVERGLNDYARWMFFLEYLSERFDGESTIISIPMQIGMQVTRIHGSIRFESFLKSCSVHFHFTLNPIENGYEINFPKLLEIKDNHTKNLQVTGKSLAKKFPLEVEEEKEIDIYSSKRASNKVMFDFESVYDAYPRKQGKTKGLQKLKTQIKNSEQFDLLKKSISNYKSFLLRKKTEPQYIKIFSTFCSEWQDWIDERSGETNLVQKQESLLQRELREERESKLNSLVGSK